MADMESHRNPKLSRSVKGSSPQGIFLFMGTVVLLFIVTVIFVVIFVWIHSKLKIPGKSENPMKCLSDVCINKEAENNICIGPHCVKPAEPEDDKCIGDNCVKPAEPEDDKCIGDNCVKPAEPEDDKCIGDNCVKPEGPEGNICVGDNCVKPGEAIGKNCKGDDSFKGKPKETICKNEDCMKTAALMASKMNESFDPCEDFHEYACGRFYRDTVLAENKVQAGPTYEMREVNELVMKAIVAEPEVPEQPVYLQNMKRLYKSCVDEDTIEEIGLQPYLSNTAFVNDWPTLNPAWDASSFNLNDALAGYAAVDCYPYIVSSVGVDVINSSKKTLYLMSPDFTLPRNYMMRAETDPVLVAFRKYVTEFAVTLGASQTVAEQDSLEMMRLLIALSKILPTTAELQNVQKMYNPMPLKLLHRLYPNIDIPRVVRTSMATANVTLADDEVVINVAPNYFRNLRLVLNTFSNRSKQNYFGFKYANSRVAGLTKRMMELRSDFAKVFHGQTTERPRWQFCVETVSTSFVMGMGKQFVERTFPEQAKVYVNDMVTNLMSSFKDILHETTWMGQATRKKALEKLAAMERKVGYPDVNFSHEDLNRQFVKYAMKERDYFSNRLLQMRLPEIENKRSLKKPVDKSKWASGPQIANAMYYLRSNEIHILAGILQPPIFSITYQDSINYGAIGTIVGHEITHGFDTIGSQVDKNGILFDWWEASDKKVFLEKVKCLIDQYSGFHISEINMTVNGLMTRDENVADNGGLKESYRAYKGLVEKKGESPTLPGLGLTQDQLFFLSFGQVWCSKQTKQMLMTEALRDPHSPGKYRIIGTLQNSEDFSRAFNCRLGSYMNPEKKCSVW